MDFGFREIEQDKVDFDTPGFHWRSHGRSSTIYFVENESVVIIYGEMSGVSHLDILVYGETVHLNKRYYPKVNRTENITIEERFKIQSLLVEWLEMKGLRHDIQIGK
jgi:hypothetical protein